MLGRQLGGSGKIPENLVTLLQNPVNTGEMSRLEAAVKRAVQAGESVEYTVTPIYNGNNAIPRAVTITAKGSRGLDIQVSIINPPGR